MQDYRSREAKRNNILRNIDNLKNSIIEVNETYFQPFISDPETKPIRRQSPLAQKQPTDEFNHYYSE